MRYWYTLLLLLACSVSLYAQGPVGKLFVYTGSGGITPPGLGYIQYPGGTLHAIDTVQLSDMVVANGKLFTAGLLNIISYDTANYHAVDTLHNAYPYKLAAWADNVVALSNARPYFRVYNVAADTLLYAIDSIELPETPNDIKVSGHTAYLALKDTVLVVDLMQRTITNHVYTPHPLAFAGYNTYLVDAGTDIYVDVEYTTSGIRSSLMRMNKTTFSVDTAYHNEGNNNYSRPIYTGSDIYVFAFNSHYNIPSDSLFLSGNSFTPLAIAFDSVSQSIFLFNSSANYISDSHGGTITDSVPLNANYAGSLFVSPVTHTFIEPIIINAAQLYPNPTGNYINIELPSNAPISSVQLYNVAGRLLRTIVADGTYTTIQMDVDQLSSGAYFVRIMSGTEMFTARFVK